MRIRMPSSAVLLLALVFAGVAHGQEQVGEDDHDIPKVRQTPAYLVGEELRAAQLYAEVLPTVVTISALGAAPAKEGQEPSGSIGSGVVISASGHVVTAAHVVERSESILVKTHDGRSRPAEILFIESSADIALLRILDPGEDLEFARLGDSDQLAIGQTVYVIGAPMALENSLSVGHISSFREFGRLYDGTILAEFIQMDAAINSGNSGGPVFSSNGEVIGIASMILSKSGGFEGLGFVITINTAKQLLALEDRGWMGIETVYLNSAGVARLLNQDLEGGLLIQHVVKGSPADKAGLRGGQFPVQTGNQVLLLGGDLILEIGEQETCHSQCLILAHDRTSHLDKIPIKLLRDGKILNVVVDVSRTRMNFLLGAAAE